MSALFLALSPSRFAQASLITDASAPESLSTCTWYPLMVPSVTSTVWVSKVLTLKTTPFFAVPVDALTMASSVCCSATLFFEVAVSFFTPWLSSWQAGWLLHHTSNWCSLASSIFSWSCGKGCSFATHPWACSSFSSNPATAMPTRSDLTSAISFSWYALLQQNRTPSTQRLSSTNLVPSMRLGSDPFSSLLAFSVTPRANSMNPFGRWSPVLVDTCVTVPSTTLTSFASTEGSSCPVSVNSCPKGTLLTSVNSCPERPLLTSVMTSTGSIGDALPFTPFRKWSIATPCLRTSSPPVTPIVTTTSVVPGRSSSVGRPSTSLVRRHCTPGTLPVRPSCNMLSPKAEVPGEVFSAPERHHTSA